MPQIKNEKGAVSRSSTRLHKHNYYFGDNAEAKHKNQVNRSREVIKLLLQMPPNYSNLDLTNTYKTYGRFEMDHLEEIELRKTTKKQRVMKLDKDCLEFTHLFESDKNGR